MAPSPVRVPVCHLVILVHSVPAPFALRRVVLRFLGRISQVGRRPNVSSLSKVPASPHRLPSLGGLLSGQLILFPMGSQPPFGVSQHSRPSPTCLSVAAPRHRPGASNQQERYQIGHQPEGHAIERHQSEGRQPGRQLEGRHPKGNLLERYHPKGQ